MATIRIGPPVIFGAGEPKPLKGFPPGRAKIRIRNDDFVRVYIKSDDGIREFTVFEEDGHWVPAFEGGSNQRTE